MIALVATFLVAVYVLGPDLIARWILGFVVPRKNLVLTKSEEITRGIMWAVIPLGLAWTLRHSGPLALPSTAKLDLQMFFSGLYSEAFFNTHRADFFAAFASFLRLNRCLLIRLYSIVLIASISFNILILNYGRIRKWLSGCGNICLPIRWFLVLFVLPRISEWHLVLSPVLLPSKKMKIEIDVLTKSGILYSGRLADKVLSANGLLENLTLETPHRFRREQYLESQKSDPKIKPGDFWKPIPGNLFVIVASDISTLNIRHIPEGVGRFGKRFNDIAEALKFLEGKLRDLEQGKLNVLSTK